MDDKTEIIIIRILYSMLAIVSLITIIVNFHHIFYIAILIGFFALSFTLRCAILYHLDKAKYLTLFSFFLDFILIISINQVDRSSLSLLFYFILISDVSLGLPLKFSASIAILSCIIQNSIYYLKYKPIDSYNVVASIFINIAIGIILYFLIYAVSYQMKQRKQLSDALMRLKIKSTQLESAYLKLQETNNELEEMAILKERNRIAKDIHDTVGHTLTTTLLQMEAAERLFFKDSKKAQDNIRLAKEQIRKGLHDIRISVHMFKSQASLIESINHLVEEVTQTGLIYIHSDICKLPKLSDIQEKVIYKAIQEGITNGIKHGNSTAFVLQLKHENKYLKMMLSDNGKGTDKIIQRFGLNSMEERVKSIGGTLSISSERGNGLCIVISIPIEKEYRLHE